MRSFIWGVACLAVLAAGSAEAKLNDWPQELPLGDMVYTQDQEELQLISRLRADRHDARNDYEESLGFEFGITKRFQLDGRVPLVSQVGPDGRSTGLDNVELGAMWMAARNSPQGPDLSFALNFQLPTASESSDRAFQSELEVIAHRQLAGALHGQVLLAGGLQHQLDPSDTGPTGRAVATLWLSLKGWYPVLEGQVKRENDWGYAFAPGLIWHPGGNFELGLSLPVRFEQQTSVGGLFTLVYEAELGGKKG